MRRRRGRGEGSVYPRKQDGKIVGYVGAVTLGYTEQGKQRRRWVYGRTKGEVLEKLDRLRGDVRSGIPVDPPRERLADYLRRWLEDEARVSVRPSTYLRYRTLLSLYVVPRLGGVPLGRLTPAHVQGLLADLERAGKSPRLREMVFRTLHRALNTALRWGMVPRNICHAVTKLRVPRLEMQVFTPPQVGQFLQAARATRLYGLYMLAVTTGMRQGELFGLQWQDVDLEGRSAHVRRQLAQSLEFLEPKTARARRMIALPEMAVTALKAHRERMLAEGHLRGEGNPLDLVFTDTEGKPLRASNFIRRSFHPLLKKTGLPRIRFHDLRHTAATLLLSQGVHPKVVQERLGHATIAMTLDIYSHVLPHMQKEAAERIDDLFVAQEAGAR